MSAVAQLQLMAQLSGWMAAEAVPAAGLTPAQVEQFVETRRRAGYRHFVSLSSLTRLVDVPCRLRRPAGAPAPSPATRAEALVEHFHSYLVSERGLAAITVRGYVRFARLLSKLSRNEELALGG